MKIKTILFLTMALGVVSASAENLEEWYKTHAYCYDCKIGLTKEQGTTYYYLDYRCENLGPGVREYYGSLADAKTVKARTCKPRLKKN
jgi:hypothetical protein